MAETLKGIRITFVIARYRNTTLSANTRRPLLSPAMTAPIPGRMADSTVAEPAFSVRAVAGFCDLAPLTLPPSALFPTACSRPSTIAEQAGQ